MQLFAQFAIVGLVTGAIYALIALGIVLVYRSTGVLNFAHAAVGVIGGFVALEFMHGGWSYFVAIPIVLMLAAVAGWLIERLIMRRMEGDPQSQTIATLGLFIVVQAALGIFWGNMWGQRFPSPFGGTIRVPGLELFISFDQVVVVLAVGLVSALLYLFLRRTKTGLAIRAAADDGVAARLCGVGVATVQPVVWVLAAVLGTLAVVLLAPITLLDNTTLTLIMLKGVAAALFGRLVSLPLTVVGGLSLGLAESLTSAYLEVPGLKESLPFFFVLVLLAYHLMRRRGSTAAALAT